MRKLSKAEKIAAGLVIMASAAVVTVGYRLFKKNQEYLSKKAAVFFEKKKGTDG